MRRHHLLTIAAVSILALAGCSNSNQQASTDGSSPSTADSPVASPASTVQTTNGSATSGFTSLKSVVSSTEADVKVGNFAKAKEDFSKFEENWKPVEDGVKAKASKTYGEIEDSADKVSSELKATKPDKAKLLTHLQSLNKNISTVAK